MWVSDGPEGTGRLVSIAAVTPVVPPRAPEAATNLKAQQAMTNRSVRVADAIVNEDLASIGNELTATGLWGDGTEGTPTLQPDINRALIRLSRSRPPGGNHRLERDCLRI